MPVETAIATPFEAGEIKDIACQELRKRLDMLSPLFGNKEYAGFDLEFQVKINLRRSGEVTAPKETLAWGNAKGGARAAENMDEWEGEIAEKFTSQEPNVERMERDMPLTVESGDGRGGKVRRKVHIRS